MLAKKFRPPRSARDGADGPFVVPEPGERGDAPLLDLADVSFGYRPGTTVIKGLNLTVAPGEFVSIVGPSGCGKSSLLRLVADFSKPDDGSIATHFRRPDRHAISMVFQEDTLLPWLRVRDNVLLHQRFTGRRRTRQAQDLAASLLAMVGLDAKADAYPAHLSGGMRRRVAVLTALAAEPELLLLDEPFSALDEPTRVGVHRDLHRLVRTSGASVVLVTHDLGEAISLSDRVVMLTPPPSHVAAEFDIPFGPDRDVRAVRSDPEFHALYARLWQGMGAEAAAGGEAR
ncbi:ABC transporter ATP-binding protein [Streptomyces sp. CA-249302]|uniref:ABC transporter ATP-binding protein n=1 Tax=Streptomyces sp. CA-249302 TaxID=3240058 RepID=UPI003D8D3C7C